MSHSRRLAAQFAAALAIPPLLPAALDALLEATAARATGLWRAQGGSLRQLGFRATEDMPADVRDTFAAATWDVPLAHAGLGIVKAYREDSPAIASLADAEGPLAASAAWLVRFGAVQSLAVPCRAQGQTRGVLAISTAVALDSASPAWQLLAALAEVVGPLLDPPGGGP